MKEKIIKPQSETLVWIMIIIGGLAAIAGGIYLGTGTAKRFGPQISGKLPKPTDVDIPMTTSRPMPSESLIPDATETPVVSDEGNFILDFSSTRLVNSDDLANLSSWELKVARNEIYARLGRKFVHKDLSCYFTKQPWYHIDPDYTDSKLTKIESTNAVFILNYEKESNSPLINKDSGCDQNNS